MRGLRRKARYSVVVARRICEAIALGKTLMKALEDDPLAPHITTFYRWKEEHPELEQMYERARRMQADLRVDVIAEMGMQVLKDPKNAAAYKVASDIFRWQAEIANPEKYGRKLEVKNTGGPPNPGELRREITRLERELGMGKAEVVDVDAREALPAPAQPEDAE